MSFWTRLFGSTLPDQRSAVRDPADDRMNKWKSAARALLANEANWQFVRDVLNRLQAAGLLISSTLNREIIVMRVLRHLGNFCDDGDLKLFFAAGNSPDLWIFLHLAGETDALYAFEEFDTLETAVPKQAELDDDQLAEILEAHSLPIFANAESLSIVNEHAPGTFIEEKLRQLEALGRPDPAL